LSFPLPSSSSRAALTAASSETGGIELDWAEEEELLDLELPSFR